jgi:hypothetical protein
MLKRPARIMLHATVVAVLAAALAACGGGGEGSAGAEKTTYTNAQYGFELTYGEPLGQVNLTASGNEEYAVAFADKDGPQVDDLYANGVRVSVDELDQTIKAADVPKLQDELEKVLAEMVEGTSGGKVTSKVTPVEIGGTPGFTLGYQFTQGGEKLTCRLTILIKGNTEFDLTEQTVSGDWDSMQSTLGQVVQSFTTF